MKLLHKLLGWKLTKVVVFFHTEDERQRYIEFEPAELYEILDILNTYRYGEWSEAARKHDLLMSDEPTPPVG